MTSKNLKIYIHKPYNTIKKDNCQNYNFFHKIKGANSFALEFILFQKGFDVR